MEPTGAQEVALPTYDENGVDLTHIREFLKLSLDDRQRTLEEFLAAMDTVVFEVEL